MKTLTKLDELKYEIKNMENLMEMFSDFGAADTEPDGVFQLYLVRFYKGKTTIPERDGWDLYSSSMKGWEDVEDKLNKQLLIIKDITLDIPRDQNEELEKYLRDYIWRVDW